MTRANPDRDLPARCPECGTQRRSFVHNGRRIFEHHTIGRGGRSGSSPTCGASGWLVEDDEVVR